MRRVRLLLAALASVLLTGCTLEGTIDVGLDTVSFDITIVYEADGLDGCPDRSFPLTVSRSLERIGPGILRCRLGGSMTLDEAVDRGLLARSGAGGLVLIHLPNVQWTVQGFGDPGTLDLTISLPGDVTVTNATGEVAGNQVRFTDARAVAADGIGLVAQTDVRGPNVWGWGLLGVVSGLAATLGVAWLMLWPQRPGALVGTPAHELLAEPERGASADPGDADLSSYPPPGDDQLPWTPAGHDPLADAPSGGDRLPDAEPPEDPSVWASEN